jgi:hypothetical protein
MNPMEVGMLIGGVVLLVVSIGLLVYCVIRKRPYKLLIGLFPLAIVMIGFSQIVSVKLPGVEINLESVTTYASNPTSPTAISNASQQFDTLLFSNKNAILPSGTKTNLTMALNELHNRPNLTPESRIAMAKLQLILGHTNDAKTNLQYALRADPHLTINPALRKLTKIQ